MMSEWLDTETKALLQNVPPEKLATPDTLGYTVVLLTKTDDVPRLRLAAKTARWLSSAFDTAIANDCPFPLLTGLRTDDAILTQFELACCDCAAVFIRDEVVAESNREYLSELYSELSRSDEFRPIWIHIHSVPQDQSGVKYLRQFLGADEEFTRRMPSQLELMVMKKKARIMCYWAGKIGAEVSVGRN